MQEARITVLFLCVRMLESAPGTRPSAQFDCLDLGLGSLQEFHGCCVVKGSSPPAPPACSAQARDFFDFLCRCLCSAASAVLVL